MTPGVRVLRSGSSWGTVKVPERSTMRKTPCGRDEEVFEVWGWRVKYCPMHTAPMIMRWFT